MFTTSTLKINHGNPKPLPFKDGVAKINAEGVTIKQISMFRKNFKKGEPCEASAKKGFSLVELLVVITIIAIMSVVAYTAVGGQTVKAKDAKRKQDIATIQQALEVYYAENGKYPTPSVTSSLKSGIDIAAGEIPKRYLSDIPKDPGTRKKDYVYKKDLTVGVAAYQLAATLEVSGEQNAFQSYVVGNSDVNLIKTNGAIGVYLNGTAFSPCNNNIDITSGNTVGIAATGPCIPYDPNNP